MHRLPAERLVFLDESGLNVSMTRSHVWVKKGTEYVERTPMNQSDYNAVFTTTPLPDSLNPDAGDAARFPAACKPAAAGADGGAWEAMAAADKDSVNQIMANQGKAVAAYERLLVSRNASFDKYVAGDTAAISTPAKRGLKIFIGKGFCVQCHSGPHFTDQKFHNDAVPQSGENVAADDGRFTDLGLLLANSFNGAGKWSDDVDAGAGKLAGLAAVASDHSAFRTKNLRGVAETAPYMHDGVYATLADVVEHYNKGGGADGTFAGTRDEKLKPLNLSAAEKADLIEFLKTLSGDPIPSALTVPNP